LRDKDFASRFDDYRLAIFFALFLLKKIISRNIIEQSKRFGVKLF
jgi:hypothetical protein